MVSPSASRETMDVSHRGVIVPYDPGVRAPLADYGLPVAHDDREDSNLKPLARPRRWQACTVTPDRRDRPAHVKLVHALSASSSQLIGRPAMSQKRRV